MLLKVSRSLAGATLLDAVFAGTLIALFLGGIFQLSARNVLLVKSGKETVSATVALQERMENLRAGAWTDVTDANYIKTILTTTAGAAGNLSSFAEQITISAFPVVSPSPTPIVVTRNSAGTVTIVTSNSTLSAQSSVRADFRGTWLGPPNGRTRVREISTLVSNGGITK